MKQGIERGHFLLLLAMTGIAVLGGVGPSRAAQPEIFTGLVEGVAVGGHDPVAYFRDGEARRGSPEIAHDWHGVQWRFSSIANRDAFAANPGAFAPQFGGYCAYAVAKGATAKGDPLAWTVTGGKLYLAYSPAVRSLWAAELPGHIAAASANWPAVLN